MSYEYENQPVILWDPNCALRDQNTTISPALALYHKIVHYEHETEDENLTDTYRKTDDKIFGNKEEERTIVFEENVVAKQLGEGVRDDHNGNMYHVSGPTER